MSKGMSSHQSASAITHEWITPKLFIDRLGPFDLDPCAASVMPWPTANEMWTRDGLSRDWHGRVWLNPPYGPYVGHWMKKLAEHGNGIALIFARTETRIFHQWCWQKADGFLFLRGRIHFCYTDGRAAKGNSGAPSVLIAYGSENARVLRESRISGQYIALHPSPVS